MLLVMSTAGIFEQSCTDSEDGIPISEAEKQRKYSALWQVSEIVFPVSYTHLTLPTKA